MCARACPPNRCRRGSANDDSARHKRAQGAPRLTCPSIRASCLCFCFCFFSSPASLSSSSGTCVRASAGGGESLPASSGSFIHTSIVVDDLVSRAKPSSLLLSLGIEERARTSTIVYAKGPLSSLYVPEEVRSDSSNSRGVRAFFPYGCESAWLVGRNNRVPFSLCSHMDSHGPCCECEPAWSIQTQARNGQFKGRSSVQSSTPLL